MSNVNVSVGLLYGHVATNLGDLAINEGILALINGHFQDPDVSVYLRNPNPDLVDRSLDGLRVKSVEYLGAQQGESGEWYDLLSMLELLKMLTQPSRWAASAGISFPNIVVGNGGEHLYGAPDGRNTLDLLWRVAPLVAAASLGSSIVQAPSTFGPFNGSELGSLLKALESVTPGLVSRDKRSLDLLSEKGFSAEVALDPAFMLPPIKSNPAGRKRLALIPRLENFGMRVGPSVSSYKITKARSDGFRTTSAYQWAKEIAVRAISQGFKIDLYIQTLADRDLVTHLSSDLKSEGYHDEIELLYPQSLRAYRELLSRVSGVVSARFHANILALSMGIPAVGIYSHSHGHKMPGLYELLEVEGAAIESESESPRTLAARALQELASMGAREAEWRTNMEVLRKETRSWFAAGISPKPRRSVASVRLSLCSLVVRMIEGEIERIKTGSMRGSDEYKIVDRLDQIYSLIKASNT